MGNLESLVVPGYPFELDQNLVACRDPACQYYGGKHPEANGIHCRVSGCVNTGRWHRDACKDSGGRMPGRGWDGTVRLPAPTTSHAITPNPHTQQMYQQQSMPPQMVSPTMAPRAVALGPPYAPTPGYPNQMQQPQYLATGGGANLGYPGQPAFYSHTQPQVQGYGSHVQPMTYNPPHTHQCSPAPVHHNFKCNWCSGSGRCSWCGGSRVRFGKTCEHCSNGQCSHCHGSGR